MLTSTNVTSFYLSFLFQSMDILLCTGVVCVCVCVCVCFLFSLFYLEVGGGGGGGGGWFDCRALNKPKKNSNMFEKSICLVRNDL